MRRGIEIRVAFAPTRHSAMNLRTAYSVVTPMVERPVIATVELEVADKQDGAAHDTPQRKIRGNR